jgi:hypothetical protein
MSGAPANQPGASRFYRNWISLTGMVIAGGSFFAFLLLFAIDFLAHHGNPYMGILTYVVAPGFLFLGLALVLAGWLLRLGQQRKTGAVGLALTIDLSRTRDRKILVVFVVASVVFLFLTALGSYQTYQSTESVQFCGQVCHLPMQPEFVTYQHSPHARVACVECHVGAGAEWYVRSKLNGVHQLSAVVTNTFHRPIETPINSLRSAQETCEQCHWPEKFIGNIDRTYSHYLSDETNTPFAVRLLLKVGGGGANGPPSGIHWHVSRGEKVEYIATDTQRQVIPWVRVTNIATGKATVYRDKDFHDDSAKYQVRTMDCIDCHTRPSHRFVSPNETVDAAINTGQLDRSVPSVKSNVVAALIASYQTTDEAMQKIATSLRAAYPTLADVDRLVAEVQQLYRDNFFPEMKTDWRVHPDNIGHKTWSGCFRCHDGNHQTDDGKKISADNCNQCHIILAQGSGDQLKQLNAGGYDFFHIDSTYLDFSCVNCHTGALPK